MKPTITRLLATGILLLSSAHAEVREGRWRWSNPRPHGNNVLDMYVSEALSVQVGDRGALYVEEGTRWAPAKTGTDQYLRSVTLMDGRLIATGENGTILWSDDYRTFTPGGLSPATADWLEGVAATAQKAVAVGDNGAIYSSSNGADWTRNTSGTTEWLRGVAYGNGVFVAVGENGTILHGSGSSWTAIESGTDEHLNRVRYRGGNGAGRFYAVGNAGTVLTSSNGDAPWSTIECGSTNDFFDVAQNSAGILLTGDSELRLQLSGSDDWINQIDSADEAAPADWMYISAAADENTFWAAGRTGMLQEGTVSTNLTEIEWQPLPSYSSRAWLWDVTKQAGICIAVGDLAHIQTSLDGILWTQEAVPASQTNVIWLGTGGTSNRVLAVGSDGQVAMSSADLIEVPVTNLVDGTEVVTNTQINALGILWSAVPAFTDQTLQGIDARDDLYIISGADGALFTSSTGTDWSQQPTPTSAFLSSVAIGPDACIAAGAAGTLLHGGADGTDWSAVPLGITNWIYRVRWSGDMFVAVGENGRIHTSPDGSDWTARDSGSSRWLTDVDYLDGRWYVSGYQGTLLSSTNLVDWTAHYVPSGKSLYGITAVDGRMITVGVDGIILRNPVIAPTDPIRILDYSMSTVADALGTNSYELFLFGGLPDQIFEFQYTTNLMTNWTTQTEIELYDASGTLFLIQSRPEASLPQREFSRTRLIP